MKKALTMILALAMMLSLVVCGAGGSTALADDPIVLKFAAEESLEHKFYPAAQEFAKQVEELTNGAVKIELYFAGQLGNASELMEAIQMDAIDITCQASSVSKLVAEYEVFDLPFLFSDAESARKVLDSDVGRDLAELFHQKNLMLLDYWELGFRYVTCNKPIYTPDDFKGVKIRVPNNKMRIAAFETIGASASTTSLSDLYLALSQKQMDASELPLGTIKSYKYDEVQEYLVLTKHVFTPGYLIISEKAWNSIPEEYHDAVLQAAAASKALVRELSDQEEANIIGELETAGMKLCEVDSTAFQEAMNPVWDEFKDSFGEYLPRILEIIS